MSDKTKAKGDAFAGSDASGVRVKQVFEDLTETLRETDPQQLAKEPEINAGIDMLVTDDRVVKEDNPEVYHDNICDPTDHQITHIHDPQDKMIHNEVKTSTVRGEEQYTGMPEVDVLRKTKEPDLNADEEEGLLSANFILDGHSYL
jgi:hypothetical protein